MWEIERYISLLMGEIPRLLDDTNGYGPNGKIYIAHVDIPMNVLKAFEDLKVEYGDLVRVANPLYASRLGYLVKRSRVVPRRSFKEICLIIDYTASFCYFLVLS